MSPVSLHSIQIARQPQGQQSISQGTDQSSLGPSKCISSMTTNQTNSPLMTSTYQTNALDISYNGWENYETWNVALWINNTESLYHLAMEAGDYETFVKEVGVGYSTPDGVKFADPKVNVIQLNSDVFDF